MASTDVDVLASLAFEIRFGDGFLYWDNCGKIWRDLSERWPLLTFREVNPQKAELVMPDKTTVITFNHTMAALSQQEPPDSEFFREVADYFTPLIVKHLKVRTITRAGFRLQFLRPLSKDESGVEELVATGLFAVSADLLRLGGTVREPFVRFILDSGDISAGIRLGFTSRNFQIDGLPPSVKVDDSRFISRGLLLDLDFFTTKPVEVGMFHAGEFLSVHERSAKKFRSILLSLGAVK